MRTLIVQVLTIAVPAMMFAHGLTLRLERPPARPRRWLMTRSALAVLVLVPLLALLVLTLVPTSPRVRVGIALMAASPIAPLALARIEKARGEPSYAATLHLTLGALAVFTAPLVLELLGMTLGFEAHVASGQIAGQLAISVLGPMVLGIVVARRAPSAARLARPLGLVAKLAVLVAAVLIVVVSSRAIFTIDPLSYLAMALFVAGALAIGHLLGGPDRADRITLALETSIRNPALALLVASIAFPSGRPLEVLIPYLLTAFVVQTIYVLAITRRAGVAGHAATPA